MRGGVERAAHVLRDAAAHRVHRLERLAGLRGRGLPAAAEAARCGRRRLGRRRRRGLGLGAGSGVGGAVAGAPDSMNARMSFFVTRPPRPVPGTCAGSTPCSDAIFATTGETNVLPSVAPSSAAPAGGCRSRGRCGRLGGRRRLGLARGLLRSRAPAARGSLGLRRGAARPRARSSRASCRPRPSRPPGRGSPARRRCPATAPRCRPCRSRSRAGSRRPRRCRRPASATS